jgi:hypothetical protein
MAKRPSDGGGMRRDNHTFLKNGSKIFFEEGLDNILISRSDLPVGAKPGRGL